MVTIRFISRASHPGSKRGFALLVAIIFMSVVLAFGLALGSIAYKQQLLSETTIGSQAAFLAADAGLECTLYADQREGLFAYSSNLNASAPTISCDGSAPVSATNVSHTSTLWITTNELSLNAENQCAVITVYKYAQPQADNFTTYVFSQGYDISCATVNSNPSGVRFYSRGIEFRY